MQEFDFLKAHNLLLKLKIFGIKIAICNDGLIIKYGKGKELNEDILSEIKTNKTDLIEYLKLGDPQISRSDEGSSEVAEKNKNDTYYEITPTQIYWINEDIDRDYKLYDRVHGNVFLNYSISGDFVPELFIQSIRFLTTRHESLRATFHKIDDRYRMKVESEYSDLFIPTFIDLRPVNSKKELLLEETVHFAGHRFDFETGPLFLVRIIQISDREFIIAFKIHHVIFDTCSEEILFKEMIIVYNSLSQGRGPQLNALNYQYRDFLAGINHFAALNRENDRKYWAGLFRNVPPELLIPGVARSNYDVRNKIFSKEHFKVSEELVTKLILLQKRHSTTLFIILQAFFKLFLYHITGQNDILIGTYVFGRDYPGAEDQIGCYAKTALIRTVLDKDDLISNVIEKVKRSNEDMKKYTAFPLRDFLEEMLPIGYNTRHKLWNVNMQFFDSNFYENGKLDIGKDITNKPNITIGKTPFSIGNSLIAIDMQLQFIVRNKALHMIAQYDGSLYSSSIIRDFILKFLEYGRKVQCNID